MSALDGARFGRLLRAHWAENWREYAWFVAVSAMLDLIFLAIFLSSDASDSYRQFQFDGQVGWYTTGLFMLSVVFAGRYFKHLASPGSALIALMRPASHLEKWLLTFLVVGVLFPLAYTLGYCLLNFPAVQLAKALNAQRVQETVPDFGFYIPFWPTGIHKNAADGTQLFFKLQVFTMLMLWAIQALLLGGTAFFKRSPILRTVLMLFLLFVGLLWLGIAPQLGAFWSQADDGIVPHSAFEFGWSLFQWAGLPLLLWVAVYFHLKEREVS